MIRNTYWVGYVIVAWLACPSPSVAQICNDDKETLAKLLTLYKELGLPLPPADAELVRLRNGAVGFRIKPTPKTEHPMLLIGASKHYLDRNDDPQVIQPTLKGIADATVDWQDLLLAIQFHARGWDEIAKSLLQQTQNRGWGLPEELLHARAWDYWEGQVIEPSSDRREVSRRLKNVIQRDAKFDNKKNRALLNSLDLALAPTSSKPGSIEATIDSLVDFHGESGHIFPEDEKDDRYRRLAILGFSAVPALIQHLDDDRLTRSMMMGFHNFHPYERRVKHVVSDLLEGLAGRDVKFDWLRRKQGYTVSKEAIAKWWAAVQTEGEEAYLSKHFLDADEPSDGGRGRRIREHRLAVLVAKYPKRVLELYRRILDAKFESFEFDVHFVPYAILKSTLPRQDKLDAFMYALKSPNLRNPVPVLSALSQLDPGHFMQLLLQRIDSFPRDTNTPYADGPESRIASLICRTEDPRAWQALAVAARRAVPGLRVQILYAAGYGVDPDVARHRRDLLTLLSQFLEDADVCDPDHIYGYPRLEVRNVVTTQMGNILGVDVGIDTNRKPEHWAILRERVRQAYAREMK